MEYYINEIYRDSAMTVWVEGITKMSCANEGKDSALGVSVKP